MTFITLRTNEGDDPQPLLAWDTIFDTTGLGDYALAGADETLNRGGLRAKAGIATAVELALFTDARCPDGHPLSRFVDEGDRRGWWGNSVDERADLGEQELGSLLWLLERAALTPDVARWAESLSADALAPLLKQGAVARIVTAAEVPASGNRLNLAISLYARDGSKIYDRKFEDLWRQAAT